MLPENSGSALDLAFGQPDYLSCTGTNSLAANKALPLASGAPVYARMAAMIPGVPGITAVATAVARASMWCALSSPGLFLGRGIKGPYARRKGERNQASNEFDEAVSEQRMNEERLEQELSLLFSV
jgi:hypothetical protein